MGLGVAVVFLIALIIFIAQNGERVDIHFLGLHAHVANGIALLIAAVGGALVTLLAGSVRIMQLRRTARRHRQADLTSNAAGRPGSAATGAPAAVDGPRR